MENPATTSWGLNISDADFAKLKRGFMPRDMDDRWVIRTMTEKELSDAEMTHKALTNGTMANGVSTDEEQTNEEPVDEVLVDEETAEEATLDLSQGGNISIRRSWTDRELYRLAVETSDGGISAKIEAITWEQNQVGRISEEQAKIDAVILCRRILGCEFVATSDYDTSLFSASRLSAAGDNATVSHDTAELRSRGGGQ